MRTNSVVLPIFSLALVFRLDLTSTTRIRSSGIRLGVGWFDALVFLVGFSGVFILDCGSSIDYPDGITNSQPEGRSK